MRSAPNRWAELQTSTWLGAMKSCGSSVALNGARLLVEPSLKNHHRGSAVDALFRIPGVHFGGLERAIGLHRTQTLVPEFHIQVHGVCQLLGESASFPSTWPLATTHVEGEANDEMRNLIFPNELFQRQEKLASGLGGEERPGMREKPELIRYGDANTRAAEIESTCAPTAHGENSYLD